MENKNKMPDISIYIFAVQNFTSIYISVSIKKALIFGRLSEAQLPRPLRTGFIMVMTVTALTLLFYSCMTNILISIREQNLITLLKVLAWPQWGSACPQKNAKGLLWQLKDKPVITFVISKLLIINFFNLKENWALCVLGECFTAQFSQSQHWSCSYLALVLVTMWVTVNTRKPARLKYQNSREIFLITVCWCI